jgi:hypothetical protein
MQCFGRMSATRDFDEVPCKEVFGNLLVPDPSGCGNLPKTRLCGQFLRAAFCKLLDDQREVRTVR